MFSVFRMGPAASGRGLCDIDSVIQSYLFTFRKIEKSWHGECIPIIIKIDKLKEFSATWFSNSE